MDDISSALDEFSSAANESFKKFIWIPIICQGRFQTYFFTIIDKNQFFSIYYTKFRVYVLFVTFNHKNGETKRKEKRRKNCIVERENAFFKSSPVDEYHLPQMNSD
jgi:hypothetical protein